MRKRSALAATLVVAVLCAGDIRGSGFAVTSARALAVTGDGKVWVIGEGTVNGLDEVTAVAAGARHVLALRRDGTVWAFGDNDRGQLGSESDAPASRPTRIQVLERIVGIACGDESSYAWTADGATWAWGRNSEGQLADGTREDRRTPVPVGQVPTVVDLSAASGHAVAATSEGTAWTWGETPSDPDVIPGLLEIGAVAAGGSESLALTEGGTVYTWSASSARPARIKALPSIASIASGELESLALDRAGFVWRWAAGGRPQMVPDLKNVVAVAARGRHLAALTTEGNLWSDDSEDLAQPTTEPVPALTSSQEVVPAVVTRTALLVIGTSTITAADNAIKLRLEGYAEAFNVTVKQDRNLLSSDYTGNPYNLVLVSSTSTPNRVSNKFTNSSMPVVIWRHDLFDDMKMTGTTSGTHFGTTASQPSVSITDGTHPLAAGFSQGSIQTVSTAPTNVLAWGVPGPGGRNVAAVPSAPTHAAIFGYELESAMVGAATLFQARRVGFFLQYAVTTSPPPLTTAGWSFFDAAVNWATATPKLPSPTISPASGTYTTSQTVTITCPTCVTGTTLRYTTNGMDPTSSSTVYTAPFSVSTQTEIRARAFRNRWTDSDVTSATYSFNYGPRPNPVISPGTQTVGASFAATITAPGDVIRYTTNGNDPDAGSTQYTGPLTIDHTLTLKARAFRTDYTPSGVARADYTLVAAVPVISLAGGPYSGPQTVTLTCATPGASIKYRTDGREPTAADAEVASGGQITVASSMTLRAKGYKPNWELSASAIETYWIDLGTVLQPVFSVPAGTYTVAQSVSITSGTAGATIRYTTDGTEPKPTSPIYSSAIPIARTTELKAKAFKLDMTWSPTTGALYVIDTGAVDQPRLSPGAGTYVAHQDVSITSETPGAVIHYTVDGTEPSETDPIITSGATVPVERLTYLRAKAWKTGMPASPTTAATYVITGAVLAGSNFSMVLRGDGTVWMTGWNAFGLLGDPSFPNSAVRTTPAPVPGLTDVVAVAAGWYHCLALKRDGTVVFWGQVGGSYIAQPTPVSGLTGIVGISSGESHVAVRNDGTVWRWGASGDPVGPAQVIPGLKGVTSVAASRFFLAVKTDGLPSGSLWSWGNGQACLLLGDGSCQSRLSPAQVPVSNVTFAAAGGFHGHALTSTGELWGWGYGTRVGDSTPANRPTPVLVTGPAAVSVADGDEHGLLIAQTGDVWSWGFDNYLELGLMLPGARSAPTQTFFSGAIAVPSSFGARHSIALRSDGTVWVWGNNQQGEFGDGTPSSSRFPVQMPLLTADNQAAIDADTDGDGLTNLEEPGLGTDARNRDTNGDGIPDGAALAAGLSATDLDMDDDGSLNAAEVAAGTDPFRTDTDGDGVADGVDAFPLDPTRSQAPPPVPGDTTPPVINLLEPTNASLISSVPPQ
jgi:alpha-tubulin suppressor-like RCC1 family protein